LNSVAIGFGLSRVCKIFGTHLAQEVKAQESNDKAIKAQEEREILQTLHDDISSVDDVPTLGETLASQNIFEKRETSATSTSVSDKIVSDPDAEQKNVKQLEPSS
jgi:hypothetical protein